jgi:hypothetical protein
VRTEPNIRTLAFLGDYLPRKCGIATFTSDLLRSVAARHPRANCFAVPVNDIEGCYQYPDVVRFEIEEQNLNSYRHAADPKAIAQEVTGLLRDATRRKTMSANAYKLGRSMVWSSTAGLYMRSFELARRQRTAATRKGATAIAPADVWARPSSVA